MRQEISRLQALIGDAPITVERITNEITRQTRFVVFSDMGDKLFEGRLEVTTAWLTGFAYSRKVNR